MAFHPWDVGVAEHGDPARLQVERAPRGAHDPLLSLQRQAVNEIEIKRCDREPPCLIRASLGLFIGLLASDRALNRRLKILEAETDR